MGVLVLFYLCFQHSWELYGKTVSIAFITFQADRAAMQLCDSADDGEAETASGCSSTSGGIPAVKAFEYLIVQFSRDGPCRHHIHLSGICRFPLSL